MNTPLTPQVRTDKNGKLVTRHVKDAAGVTSVVKKVPAPSLAQFRVPERDVKRPHRAGTSLSAKAEAKRIREFFGVPSAQEVADPIRMSDNEILDYMQEGFTATAAVEFKRWGVAPEAARMSNTSRLAIKETIRRMRELDLSPDEAMKIIRNGMTDNLLDKYLTDNELFGLLHEEKAASPKYHERARGVQFLISGACTREDYHELSLEQMGKYGSYLNVQRKNGDPIDYDLFRATIQKVEEPYVAIPAMRYDEGWTIRDSQLGFHSVSSLVKKYGPEILELKHMGVARMGLTIGDSLDSYRFMDEFFTVAGDTKLALNAAQRTEMQSWKDRGYTVADMTARMRAEGLTPEQSFHALSNQLTLEHAKEVHLNKQAISMMGGWL